MSFTLESWFQTKLPNVSLRSASAVIELAAGGATVPFIARYRKEATGNLDEVAIRDVIRTKELWDEIIKRQRFILTEIESQGKLTEGLKTQISSTFDLDKLEDLYLPYKKKKKTKAEKAREEGFGPLADWIWAKAHGEKTSESHSTLDEFLSTIDPEKKPHALQGAQDILTERLSETQELRQAVRKSVFEKALLKTQAGEKSNDASKFKDYFEYQESIISLQKPEHSHRYLAIRRGWTEQELKLTIFLPPEVEGALIDRFEGEAASVKNPPAHDILKRSAQLAFKAYVLPSIETEVHRALKDSSDEAAISVFSENVRKLLLAAPFGSKSVLGVDPGIRTGCKAAVVDDTGAVKGHFVFKYQSERDASQSQILIREVVKNAGIRAIAVGNGTAGRETETFLRKALAAENLSTIPVVMVSESGASIYSASDVAREEFPDLDLTVRGAISIARRLQDPLSELVKVDPKSIGVGQYQHDVSQPKLKKSLDDVVDSCVNSVGVDLNTASHHLLAHVSGIGPSLAKGIVEYRSKNGAFKSRNELLSVPRFSQKVFEQSAGFLRIRDGAHPLDQTGVHPERYGPLERLCKKMGRQINELLGEGVRLVKEANDLRDEVGEFTFADIIRELEKPGRDPRDAFVPFQFRPDIHEVKDLKPGMECPGIVTNVTNFGAFVDIGVHQDGLVHISEISDRFVKDPKEVVSAGDLVRARVIEVDLVRNRISLSLKKEKTTSREVRTPKPQSAPRAPRMNPNASINSPFGALAGWKPKR